jgi:hypothetical protein
MGRVWATRAITVPAAGAAVGTVALASLTPMPTLAAGVVATGAALYGAHKIHPWRERLGHSRKSLEASAIAEGDADIPIILDHVPDRGFGRYALGRTVPGYREMVWDPLGDGPPHILIAGTTGGGKSETASSLLVPQARQHGIRVIILDIKQGLDYQDLLGPDAEVYSTPAEWRTILTEVLATAKSRAETMLATRIRRTNPKTGLVHLLTPRKHRELPEALAATMPPILIIGDEGAQIVADDKCKALISRVAAETRAVGVSLALATQRPDAALFGGLIKHNLGVRLLLGRTDPTARQMVIGGGIDAQAIARGPMAIQAAVAELRDRKAGVGEIAGLASPAGTHRFRAYLLDRLPLTPLADDQGHGEQAEHTDGEAFLVAPPSAPGASLPDVTPAGDPSDPRSGVDAPGESTPFRGSPPAAGRPGAPAAARLAGPAWLVEQRIRARLRLGVLRLLAGPRTPLADDRPPTFRYDVRERCGLVCNACDYSGPGRYHADHVQPRWHFRDDDEGRDDPVTNGQMLCAPHHVVKSKAEMRVWWFRARVRRLFRLSPLRVNHRPPAVSAQWVWGVGLTLAFLLGWFDGRWWLWALGLTVFNTFIIAMISKRYRKLFGKQRGAGVNAISDWDMAQEKSNAEGADRATVGIYYWTRKTANRARLWPLFVTCTYLLGCWWVQVATHTGPVVSAVVGAVA